ncbi:hypothetical protein GCM10027446_01810 [Angustibacter peucedani]
MSPRTSPSCSSPAAAPTSGVPRQRAVRARRGNVVALSDLPRVTQGKLAQRLVRVDHPGRVQSTR